MAFLDVFADHQNKFTSPDITRVIFALRQDAAIWKSLQKMDPGLDEIIGYFDTISSFSPANIGMKILGLSFSAADLAASPMMPLDPNIETQALKAFEAFKSGNASPVTLTEAVLVSLGAREQHRKTGSWDGLITAISAPDMDGYPGWQPVLTCLVAMVTDPVEILARLLDFDHQPGMLKLVTHVILGNLFGFQAQLDLFRGLMIKIPETSQLAWLRLMDMGGNDQLVYQLAKGLMLQIQESIQPDTQATIYDTEFEKLIQAASNHKAAGEISLYAGLDEISSDYFGKAGKLLRECISSLNLQKGAAEFPFDADPDAREIHEANQVHASGVNGSGEIFVDREMGMQLVAGINPGNESQILSILDRAIQLSRDGEIERAQKIGIEIVEDLIHENMSDRRVTSALFRYIKEPGLILGKLILLGLDDYALKLAYSYMELRPGDQGVTVWLSKLLETNGDTRERLDNALINMLLDNGIVDTHRVVAGLWEELGENGRAFIERKNTVEMVEDPPPSDWMKLAASALLVGDFSKAIEASTNIEQNQMFHAEASLIKARAFIGQEKTGEAAVILERLTREDPQMSQPWLLLSNIYLKEGRKDNHKETLLRAVDALPGSADLNYSLALVYLESGDEDEALKYLQDAAALSPGDADISYSLGKILLGTGQLDQARQVISNGRKIWPLDLKLARVEADILLDLGETEAALSPMEIVIEKDPPAFQNYLLYAEALLGGKNTFLLHLNNSNQSRILKAQEILEKAVEMEPQNIEANLLLAEVRLAYGHFEKAFTSYQLFLEHPESRQPQWRWRIQYGFGISAIKLGRAETALVVLQEASAELPDHIDMHRLLSEAYRLSNLGQEAFNTARYVLQMIPDDLGNLVWYADMVRMLGENQAAHDAYQSASRMAPDNPGIILQLAELQVRIGDLEAGKQSLARLLNFERLSAEHWQRAAYLFIRLGDRLSALTCLEEALQINGGDTPDILFEIACIQQMGGDLEKSLESTRKAIVFDQSSNWYFIVFESDLLTLLEQYDEALASLEKVGNQFIREKMDNGEYDGLVWPELIDLLPSGWLLSLKNFSGISIRQAFLLNNIGRDEEAIEASRKAVEAADDNLIYNLFTAELLRDSLEYEEADHLLSCAGEPTVIPSGRENEIVHEYFAVSIETALEKGSLTEAISFMEKGRLSGTETPRLMAAIARIKIRQGDYRSAHQLFEQAWKYTQEDQVSAAGVTLDNFTGVRLLDGVSVCHLWLAEAAIEVFKWEKANLVLEKATVQYSGNLRANLVFATAMITAAEQHGLYTECMVVTHAPGIQALGEVVNNNTNQCIQAVSAKLKKELVYRLSIRAQLAFHPELQTARSLDWKKLTPDEALPIAGHLRRMKETSAAISVLLQLPTNTEILLQHALCYRDKDPEKGFKAAREAANSNPDHPIYQAVLAILANKYANVEAALNAIEKALTIWENEPEWQALAADLSASTGDRIKAISHWEKAVSLNPARYDYAIHLSQEYLASDDKRKAIHILEVSAKANPSNFDLHNSLAGIYLSAGRVNEALDYAERANKLRPAVIDNLMICAEASSQLRKWKTAMDYANQVIKIYPDHKGAVLLIARVFIAQGKKLLALDLIETSSRNVVSSEEISFERVKLILSISGARAALPAAKELANNFEKNPLIYKMLAEIQSELGDHKNASDSAEKSIQLNPRQPDLYHLIGKLKKETGDLDQAIHFLKEALQYQPDSLDIYYDLSQAYVDKREFLLALGVYEQIIKKAPGDYQPYYSAAMIQRDIKNYQEAEKMLRKAADLAPNDLNIRRQLGAVIALNLVHNKQEAG